MFSPLPNLPLVTLHTESEQSNQAVLSGICAFLPCCRWVSCLVRQRDAALVGECQPQLHLCFLDTVESRPTWLHLFPQHLPHLRHSFLSWTRPSPRLPRTFAQAILQASEWGCCWVSLFASLLASISVSCRLRPIPSRAIWAARSTAKSLKRESWATRPSSARV